MSQVPILLPAIRESMGYSETEFSGALGISIQKLNKIRHTSELRLDQLSRLADTLNCTLETFARGFFDLSVIENQFLYASSSPALPLRYQKAQFSRVRTSASLFEFIEEKVGRSCADRVRKTLQISKSLISDHERTISMQLVIDVADLMHEWGASPQFLESMGYFSASTNKNGPIGKFVKECASPKQAYEKIVPVVGQYFEKNHDYTLISLSKKECVLEAKVSELVKDTLGIHRYGNRSTCALRTGVMGSISLYVGHKPKRVEHPVCIHRGNDRCVYHIIF